MLYYCTHEVPVWKGLDLLDIYTRVGCVNEGETIIVIGHTPDEDYFNVMTSDGIVGWVSGYFLRNKRLFQPVQDG